MLVPDFYVQGELITPVCYHILHDVYLINLIKEHVPPGAAFTN
jgi:hypothetical protein